MVKAPQKEEAAPPEISLDLTGKKPGRGAYLCRDAQCLRLARKSRRLERAFSCKIPEEVYDRMEEEIQRAQQAQEEAAAQQAGMVAQAGAAQPGSGTAADPNVLQNAWTGTAPEGGVTL